jgi:signal transduction histidine kinase
MDGIGAISQLLNTTSLSGDASLGAAIFGAGLGLFCVAGFAAAALQGRRTRARLRALERDLRQARADQNFLTNLTATETQIFVTWDKAGTPRIAGDSAALATALGSEDFLTFSHWLGPSQSAILSASLATLRERGTSFNVIVSAHNGRHIEADGRPIADAPVLRLRDVSTHKRDFIELQSDHENLKIEAIGLRAMLDTLGQPIWLRDRTGRLSWVNEPYAFAVDAESRADAIASQAELLDPLLRKDAAAALQSGNVFQTRAPIVVSGQRRVFDIVETPLAAGTIGYASDVSDLEAIRSDLQKQMTSHVRTLDQLPTAVAIFDEKQRLVFSNLAYRNLWQLDEAFIASQPSDNEILDRLRDQRRLPEQADYKSWKKILHEAYHSLDTREFAWYLPGGRTLRVVVNPDPQGGVTYLFDDMTAQFALESHLNALSRVQSETLDSLNEGVAVFGTDGRHKFNNPAFERIWDLDAARLAQHPHIDQIILDAHHLYADTDVWSAIKGGIAGVNDRRQGQYFRMERYDGSVIDCALTPLPDGATLVTFVDVSASVNVERALTERNEALVEAARLRENFVHHVSYQLRSPLTNVIGFTELLASGAAGDLNDRQSDYVAHVMQSSNALLHIIDDILDLASFDRGEITLAREDANIKAMIDEAVSGLEDRLSDRKVTLTLEIADNLTMFRLDAKRVRQILFNLISNAIGFSQDGQTVTVSARETLQGLQLTVQDEGRGIPADVIDRVFDRFETHTAGTRHRGAGLGLSIVRALVELHGGEVRIVSEPGHGTRVTCVFPRPTESIDATEAA